MVAVSESGVCCASGKSAMPFPPIGVTSVSQIFIVDCPSVSGDKKRRLVKIRPDARSDLDDLKSKIFRTSPVISAPPKCNQNAVTRHATSGQQCYHFEALEPRPFVDENTLAPPRAVQKCTHLKINNSWLGVRRPRLCHSSINCTGERLSGLRVGACRHSLYSEVCRTVSESSANRAPLRPENPRTLIHGYLPPGAPLRRTSKYLGRT
jgi:hypothetical protein